jgi:hypothetical protein
MSVVGLPDISKLSPLSLDTDPTEHTMGPASNTRKRVHFE